MECMALLFTAQQALLIEPIQGALDCVQGTTTPLFEMRVHGLGIRCPPFPEILQYLLFKLTQLHIRPPIDHMA